MRKSPIKVKTLYEKGNWICEIRKNDIKILISLVPLFPGYLSLDRLLQHLRV
jgi:hypothetical protein